jgi:ATP-binding cassette subfamily C (CFTR/MRP) protein 1
MLIGSQLISYLISEHLVNWQCMVGARSSNALTALIYDKHMNISSATSKEFSNGEIVNFMQVDADMLFWLCFQMSDVAKIPFVFALCFTLFFIYVGYSFFAGLAVFILSFVVNGGFGLCLNKIQTEVMKRKDDRMKETSESLENMKALKLNSY